MIIFSVCYAGMTLRDSWPIAVYPTFAYLSPRVRTTLEVTGIDGAGRETALRLGQDSNMRARFGDARWQQLLERVAATPDTATRRLLATDLLSVTQVANPNGPQAQFLRLYRVTRSVDPAHWDEPPLNATLLHEFRMPVITAGHWNGPRVDRSGRENRGHS